MASASNSITNVNNNGFHRSFRCLSPTLHLLQPLPEALDLLLVLLQRGCDRLDLGTNLPKDFLNHSPNFQANVKVNVLNISSSAESITLQAIYTGIVTKAVGIHYGNNDRNNDRTSRGSEISPEHLQVRLVCWFRQNLEAQCKRKWTFESKSKDTQYSSAVPQEWTCNKLSPFSQYQITLSVIYQYRASSWDRGGHYTESSRQIYTNHVSTIQGVPEKPAIINLEIEKGDIEWDLLTDCNGPILGYQMIVTEQRDYDDSYLQEYSFNLTASDSFLILPDIRCATKYNITLRAHTYVGWGQPNIQIQHTRADENFRLRPLSILKIADSLAVVSFEPVSLRCVPISSYQIIVMSSAAFLEVCTRSYLREFDPLKPDRPYISHQILRNSSERITVTIGDGQETDGYLNVPLDQDREYTVTLRAVIKWNGVTTFQCSPARQIL
ncbi:receptor-type tyrosine-protein phosphatase U-like, partial [Chiloscyllium punctatum]|uniref:receptor-type tyrosine-protein phosphatase U-like n=1 Tax=Chiloscyllium punctatum TaxID=137246 RepID=UPI003B63A978